MHNEQSAPERIEKPAQIARAGVQVDRKGETGWFEFEGKSVHVYLRDFRGQCAQQVYSPLGNGHSIPGQCSRTGKLECNGFKFCGQHYPPNVRAKEKERHQRWERESAARTKEWAAEKAARDLRERALDAIKLIAAGHNDPRTLAQEVLNPRKEEPDHG